MVTARSASDRLFSIVTTVFLLIIVTLMLYPFVVTLSTSISDSRTLVQQGAVYLFPRGFSLAAYDILLQTPGLGRFYLNTVFYAVAGTFLMLIICCLTAYPLSLKTLPGRKPVMIFLVITFFFNGGLIPYYLWLKQINLIDNVWVMIIPGMLNVWNIIIFRTFFQQLPTELIESAHIDGANDFRILRSVIVPLSTPVIATFAIFGLIGVWNDFFTAMIFLNNPDLMPLQILLRRILILLDSRIFSSDGVGDFGEFADGRPFRAASVIATIISIAWIYPLFQKYFTKGMLIGSIKG